MPEFIRYGLAGVINTAVGYGTFLIAFQWADFSPAIANMMGYILGLSVAFILQRLFVFKPTVFSYVMIARFLCSFFIAFGFNQIVLALLVYSDIVRVEISQIFAMAAFTVLFYLFNKYFVFMPKNIISHDENAP